MVDHDDPGPLRPTTELGVEPAVVLAPDLALVDVGLGGVDRHDLRAAPATYRRDRVARPEEVLEVPVADVAGIVIAHRHHDVAARERVEEPPVRCVIGIEVGSRPTPAIARARPSLGRRAYVRMRASCSHRSRRRALRQAPRGPQPRRRHPHRAVGHRPLPQTPSKHAPRRASTADASATSCAGAGPVPQAAGPAPVEQAELERQLSSSRSAPPLRPAAARGWPARRQPPAARSSGRPNSRRPARGAAWPSRRPGS